MKILFKYPTRQRPKWFKETLNKWQSMLSGKHDCFFVISCDKDDDSMRSLEMVEFMDSFANVVFRFGNNKTKIEACNADMDICNNWDIVVLVSDDMVPLVYGYDDIIVNDMLNHFPDLDGALHYPDGLHGGKTLITLTIMGRKLYDYFGYIYHPEYKSFYCDTEFTSIVYSINKCVFVDNVIIKHEWMKNKDELYASNQHSWNHDKSLYEKRLIRVLNENRIKSQILFGVNPTKSFIDRPNKCIDIDVCRTNLLDCKECCDDAGLKFWLSFGTLLGAVREGNFIAHDHDTDVGIFYSSLDELCLALAKMEEKGFEIARTQLDLLVSVMRNGEYIDFYRFKEDKDTGISCCNETHIATERLRFAESISFLGQKFNVPYKPKALLAKQYGDDWQTPIKGKLGMAI